MFVYHFWIDFSIILYDSGKKRVATPPSSIQTLAAFLFLGNEMTYPFFKESINLKKLQVKNGLDPYMARVKHVYFDHFRAE